MKRTLLTLLISSLISISLSTFGQTDTLRYILPYTSPDNIESDYRAVFLVGSWDKGYAKHGYAKGGKLVINTIYENVEPFSEGLAAVQLNEKWGVINQQGQMVISPVYDWISSFQDGYALVASNNKNGIINRTGKVIVPIIYNEVTRFNNGIARVTKDEKMGFVDTTGKVVVAIQYDKTGFGNEGLIGVNKDGKAGFIDYKGNVVIPFIYEATSLPNDFANGLGRVYDKKDGFYGYIDRTGKKILNVNQYMNVTNFAPNGVAVVQLEEFKYGAINRKGELVIEPKYGIMYHHTREYAFFIKDINQGNPLAFNAGIVDSKGKEYFTYIGESEFRNSPVVDYTMVNKPVKIYTDKNLTAIQEVIVDFVPVKVLEKAVVKREGRNDLRMIKIKYNNKTGWVLAMDVSENGLTACSDSDLTNFYDEKVSLVIK